MKIINPHPLSLVVNQIKIIYFSVKETRHKLGAIVSTAHKHLRMKKNLYILCADKTTLHFVSQLLWNEPKESFLPHSLDGSFPNSLIQLILPQPSYSQLHYIFNLTSQAILQTPDLKAIYEMDDQTHPAKREIFEKKFKLYQDAGYTLCSN